MIQTGTIIESIGTDGGHSVGDATVSDIGGDGECAGWFGIA